MAEGMGAMLTLDPDLCSPPPPYLFELRRHESISQHPRFCVDVAEKEFNAGSARNPVQPPRETPRMRGWRPRLIIRSKANRIVFA